MNILEECVLDLSKIEGATIPYVQYTALYGNAEFDVCLQWKRGRIAKLFIYPRQQPAAKYFYVADIESKSDAFNPFSWTHLGVENPRPWIFTWCKVHKCMSMSIYTPKNTNQLRIVCSSTLQMIFE